MNEVKIQTFWSEMKMDAGFNNSGMTFYDNCNVVEIVFSCSQPLNREPLNQEPLLIT
jgi:hypothetical protein